MKEPPPRGTWGPPTPPKQALAEAYQQVIESEKQKRDDQRAAARAPRPAKRSPIVIGGGLFLAALVGYVALNPEWLGLGRRQETPVEQAANVRLTMYVVARELYALRDRTGQFPASLDSIRGIPPGVALRYQKTPSGFRLEGEHQGRRATLTEADPLDRFVGPSLTQLVQERRR